MKRSKLLIDLWAVVCHLAIKKMICLDATKMMFGYRYKNTSCAALNS